MAFGNAIRTNIKRIIYVLLSSLRRPAIPLCRIKHTHHQRVSDVASSRRRPTQTTDALEPNVVVPVHTHPLRWICSHTHAAHNIYAVSYLWRSHSSSQPGSEMKLPRINSRAPSHYTETPLCRYHTISDFHDGFVNRKCGNGLKCKQFGDVSSYTIQYLFTYNSCSVLQFYSVCMRIIWKMWCFGVWKCFFFLKPAGSCCTVCAVILSQKGDCLKWSTLVCTVEIRYRIGQIGLVAALIVCK